MVLDDEGYRNKGGYKREAEYNLGRGHPPLSQGSDAGISCTCTQAACNTHKGSRHTLREVHSRLYDKQNSNKGQDYKKVLFPVCLLFQYQRRKNEGKEGCKLIENGGVGYHQMIQGIEVCKNAHGAEEGPKDK